jgi:uncharacterized membrane protein
MQGIFIALVFYSVTLSLLIVLPKIVQVYRRQKKQAETRLETKIKQVVDTYLNELRD